MQSLVGFDFALGKYVHISFQKYLKKALINLCKITNGEHSCRLYIDKEDGEEILSRIKFKDKDEDRKNMVEILGLIGIGPYFTIPRNNFDKRSYGEIIYNIACQNVEEETKQAMEALVFNFNSLHSRAGSQVNIVA